MCGGVEGSLYSLSLGCQILVTHDLSQLQSDFVLHLLKVLAEPFKIGQILSKASCGFPKPRKKSQ